MVVGFVITENRRQMATKTSGKKSATSAKSAKTSRSAKTAKTTKTTKSSKASSQSAKPTNANDLFEPIFKKVKSLSWMGILESLVIGVFGILLVVNSEQVTELIFNVIGIFLMIKGAYKIINYFAVHGRYNFYNNDLLYGVIALVMGIVVVIFKADLMNLIGIVVGIWMIYGALVRMNTAIKLHTANVKEWFYVLLLAMVMLALGLYLIISASTAIPTIIGWVMIAAAVVGVVDDLIFLKRVDSINK